jgi:hydrogenase maturation protein HypF
MSRTGRVQPLAMTARVPAAPHHQAESASSLLIGGRVQGVGFRPFVYRLAHRYHLAGWVKNRAGQVEVFVQGSADALHAFSDALLHEAPPLARPEMLRVKQAPVQTPDGFAILPSDADAAPQIHVPPDFFACADCLRELHDTANRRYRYPFINCTQCGPRYTLITRLPYDRPNTTMAGFPLCPECRREYEDRLDRRFHAEPIACPVCGPQLHFVSSDGTNIRSSEAALRTCVDALRAGQIVAVKGIGGYHLMCDAGSHAAVARLRATKPRPHKPLAVMFPVGGADALDRVRASVKLTEVQATLITDPMRPIVLAERRDTAALTPDIAPGLREVGVFLPYSPLHHLILEAFDAPLVATSGNVSGEPVLTDNDQVQARLGHVANAYLHHDRPIERPADDPVFRVIAKRPRPIRLGRGSAPLELALPLRLSRPIIAVGGNMKNCVALAWDQRVVLSPHIGDLEAPRSLAVFEQVIADLQQLYKVQAEAVVCDAHPGYTSTRWAQRSRLPVTAVLHHHAHASAVAGEFPEISRWLAFTWDGVGYGVDGTLWGGEAFLGEPGQWIRAASMRPFFLPGGEKAAREPWRSALALCWEAGIEWPACPEDERLLYAAWRKRVNAPQTTAVGRLFDAAAALTGLNHRSSFEGQGPMYLEAACTHDIPPVPLPLTCNKDGLWETDWAPLLPRLLDTSTPASERAAGFHASLAHALVAQAQEMRDIHGEFAVALSGGVFQNRVLTEQVFELLAQAGFAVRFGERIPCNDAGIGYGQVIEYQTRVTGRWTPPDSDI